MLPGFRPPFFQISMDRIRPLKIFLCIAAALGAAMFVSCRNDIDQVNALTGDRETPPTVIDTFFMVRSDSGKVAMHLRAARVVMEPDPKNRSLISRKASGGVEMIMYQAGTDSVKAHLTSHRAIEHATSKLFEALGDVVVVNDQQDTIRTERLLWDQQKHIFYTDQFARIVRDGDVLMPQKGFEADENFRWYNLFNSKGDINIEDSLSRPAPPEMN